MTLRAYDVRLLAIRAIMNNQPRLVIPQTDGHVVEARVDGYGYYLTLATDDTSPVNPRSVRDLLRYCDHEQQVLITRQRA